ncbi:zinc finger transcription factor E2S-VP64 [Aphelenchoides avenae]|nr:zinc finger transcription factor E2S-VP64 [Aphelenchus avenae]
MSATAYVRPIQLYCCPYCDKICRHRGQLNVHLRVHTGEQPYACTVCERRFSHRDSLKRHQEWHLGETYDCYACKKSFRSIQPLGHHIQQYHNGVKPFACTKCDRRFFVARELERHVCTLTHGGKLLECQWCDKTFSQSGRFYDHIKRTHPDEKPFQCTKCPERFSRKRHLTEHLRLGHAGQRVTSNYGGTTGLRWDGQAMQHDGAHSLNFTTEDEVEEFVVVRDKPAAAQDAPHQEDDAMSDDSSVIWLDSEEETAPAQSAPSAPAGNIRAKLTSQRRPREGTRNDSTCLIRPSRSATVKVIYKYDGVDWLVFNDKPSPMTFDYFRQLIDAPKDCQKSFIFRSDEEGLGLNEWMMVTRESDLLPTVRGCIIAEPFDEC